MIHFTKYGKRMRITMISSMTTACVVCLFAFPFINKSLLSNKVGYYTVMYNGEKIGAVNSEEEARSALADARLKFDRDYDEVIYINPDIEVVKENKAISTRMTQDEMAAALYTSLFESVVELNENLAYTLRVDDFTVSLESKKDVVQLLERITDKYDQDNEFQANLLSQDNLGNIYDVAMVKSEVKNTDVDILAAAMDGGDVLAKEKSVEKNNGLLEIKFGEQVQVNQTIKSSVSTLSVDEAYNLITKEKQEKSSYYVEEGDCLSTIAAKFNLSVSDLLAMNTSLTENSVLIPGDEIVTTVPRSEISVVTVERKTYDEDYEADVQYIDDDTAYRGVNTVVSEGSTGHRTVTADITYTNGAQTDVKYIEQNVTKTAEPKIVKVGTLTRPTYIKPVKTGRFSSAFGMRDGKMHKGVDWAMPVGTDIYAAADGKVVRASMYSGYGYCIDIKHNDGSMTRYGHLSSMKVRVGQTVSQGDIIAKSGNTGYSTGPHLHFEIWIGGNAVNPLQYVNKN